MENQKNKFRFLGTIILTGLLLIRSYFPAVEAGETSSTKETANPHFQAEKCYACHPRGMPPGLETTNIDDLCNSCHRQDKIRDEIHPSHISGRRGAVQKIPKEFPLISGKMTCNTCHDTFIQCRGDDSRLKKNPLFLRGGPYMSPWDICFQCHDSSLYDVFDPHDQIDDRGKRRGEVCLYCHETPHPESPDAVVGKPSVNICRSCHWVDYRSTTKTGQIPKFRGSLNLSDSPRNHSAGSIKHMRREPSPKMRDYIKNVEKQKQLHIPLNARGEIYCSTCHNPHEKGVFLDNDPRFSGSEGDHPVNNRIRVSSGQICVVCHDINKYGGNPALLYRPVYQ